jgi:hypothetical protein
MNPNYAAWFPCKAAGWSSRIRTLFTITAWDLIYASV